MAVQVVACAIEITNRWSGKWNAFEDENLSAHNALDLAILCFDDWRAGLGEGRQGNAHCEREDSGGSWFRHLFLSSPRPL